MYIITFFRKLIIAPFFYILPSLSMSTSVVYNAFNVINFFDALHLNTILTQTWTYFNIFMYPTHSSSYAQQRVCCVFIREKATRHQQHNAQRMNFLYHCSFILYELYDPDNNTPPDFSVPMQIAGNKTLRMNLAIKITYNSNTLHQSNQIVFGVWYFYCVYTGTHLENV